MSNVVHQTAESGYTSDGVITKQWLATAATAPAHTYNPARHDLKAVLKNGVVGTLDTDYTVTTGLSALDVDTIAYQAATGFIRYTFNGTPDLSGVKAGDSVTFASSGTASNDGTFIIAAVSDSGDYIDVVNPDRADDSDDEASDSASVGAITYSIAQVNPKGAAAGDVYTLQLVNRIVSTRPE